MAGLTTSLIWIISSLTAAGYAYRFPSHHLHHLHRRDTTWTALGCWTDGVDGTRTLSAATYTDTVNMTIESCVNFCSTGSNAYAYAGVGYAQECYCGNYFFSGATNVSSSDCDMACTGNAGEFCGAGNRLDIFWSGVQPPAPPILVSSLGNWSLLGCYNDSATRALPYGTGVTGSVTVESCTTACYNAGYPYAGMEYADECYCGMTIENNSGPTPDAGCDMTCAGNSSEYCGGSYQLSMYSYTQAITVAPVVNSASLSTVSPVTSGLTGNWTYGGCYVDNVNGRVIGNEFDSSNMIVESCIANCAGQNFTIAAIEYSTQCYCGDYLINGATKGTDSECNMACGGNAIEACGGPNLLSVYSSNGNITLLPVPVLQTTNLPGQWVYEGCLAEPSTGPRTFQYENEWDTNNTVDACLNQCAAFGYPVAGLEYGVQCFCGDVSDITAVDGTYVSDSQCNMACSGDPIHLCGAGNRLSTYYWNGTMNTWNTPANTGYYEFLIGGLVVPLIATVGINNKVTFLEKWGTSEYDNSTGAYELDLSLVDNYQLAWREMHVQTDVFCSGSIILPDLGGRQINVGGWSLSSTFGVRLYTPDGSPGVNGTNDWEENVNELTLQRGRWYPTAMMMPNGSILVVGGESGSNASPQPSLEILPAPPGGDTVVTLDYLQRTDPYNLYPFLMVLPSGRFFIGYYNEARILDPITFDTVTVLPNMPGAVNNFLAGRTYPMEGSAVLLPQYAPYTDPIEVLICGGSTIGAAIALDNCISIAPEVPNARWTLERMPSKRVMPCITTLPDGTYLIMNGAHQGVAGFGLATDPNLGAILYDPSQPIGQRISILNNTIVARLYHSEATLLPDGRVLVSGSDPQTNYPNGSRVYPEEMRIEVYVPPYLNRGFMQPEFKITETDWKLGGQYIITVTLFQGTTNTMRISLVAASSSTHGNVMSGGRILFPAFSCSGNTCTITAPPNAYVSPPGWHQLFILDGPTPSHSAWVRIGGDPAQLGNWPDYPDFTKPGV
ncbi:copper radical oxidase-like protein [Suillus subalutaceus]|uniref:copper radical oxidase-like protein n=1 Tax=Suillus subalutaceus TaxID=48586 RepID=UPI001B85DF86|nr:copper radical oxidase-like protein [Suillus subalutaceus]KAG1865028.1 copper radical oxidase-like protein [Suillus subalutaceus]